MQEIPNFKAQMEQQGITNPKDEVMKRLQGQNMNNPRMQMIQGLMSQMGLHF